jgi:hypothetical protein
MFSSVPELVFWLVHCVMAFSTVMSILVSRQSLYARVQERVEGSLVQEVEEFRRLVKGRDPATGQPFGDDVAAIFNVFLSRNIPDDEFLLALVGHLARL